jgi:hypothetical protein
VPTGCLNRYGEAARSENLVPPLQALGGGVAERGRRGGEGGGTGGGRDSDPNLDQETWIRNPSPLNETERPEPPGPRPFPSSIITLYCLVWLLLCFRSRSGDKKGTTEWRKEEDEKEEDAARGWLA